MAAISELRIFKRKEIALGGMKLALATIPSGVLISATDFYPQGVNRIIAAFPCNNSDAGGFASGKYNNNTAAVTLPVATPDMVKINVLNTVDYSVFVLGF